MNNITLKFSNITNNNVACKNPIVYIFGAENVAFPCGDKVDENGEIKLTIPESLFAETCIRGVIKCDECSSCPEQEFEVCLCNDTNDCAACQTCQDGICVDLCPGKKCVNNTCCDCETQADCPTGFICTGCNCLCPSGKVNDLGQCVQCLGNTDCGPCGECINGNCVSKCPGGFVCDNNECVCPPGTEYDPVTKTCKPLGCTSDANCKECEICVGGQCQPIVCPEGYTCLNGECVEACKDVTCNNGADCGENCGCLNGKCVPCSTLNCLTGECSQALGCECNNNKCEPIDNCGQYCDGTTPCLDPNCTCYNNECVNCKNFPCNPDDCSTHYNCGCNGNGECGGGAGCDDELKLTKNEDCNTASGCELLAEYITDNKCGCEPIEFKIKHFPLSESDTPPGEDTNPTGFREIPTILNLKTALYKNNVPYADYLNQISIGDDELVSGVLRTTITHQIDGKIVNVGAAPVADVAIINNSVADIKITNNNIKKAFEGKGTLITIEVRAVNIDIVNNDCTQYEDEIITTYVLDYRTPSSTLVTDAKIANEFKLERSTKVTDTKSVRRPMFIWSKSSGSSFNNTKFNNSSETYSQSGWFRKEYGYKNPTTGVWTDKINNPAEQLADGQFNELWNNYNYKVTVDCGCKANTTVLEKVIFCCTENIDTELTNCNKTLTIKPFNVCDVNKRLTSSNPQYKFPEEVQTYFRIRLNDGFTQYLNNLGGPNTTNVVITRPSSITSILIDQVYKKGNTIVHEACVIEETYDEIASDFEVTVNCDVAQQPNGDYVFEVVVPQRNNPSITGIEVKLETAPGVYQSVPNGVVNTQTGSNFVAKISKTVINKGLGNIAVFANLSSGCTSVKIVEACEPMVKVSLTTKVECVNATKPKLTATPVGFLTPPPNITYSISKNNGPFSTPQNSNEFPNLTAGSYIVKATQVVSPTLTLTATSDVITVDNPLVPTITFTPAVLCNGVNSSSTMVVTGAPGAEFQLTGPQVGLPLLNTIPPSGSSSFSVGTPGTYKAKFTKDNSGKMCIESEVQATLIQKGETVTPSISWESSSTPCVGNTVKFALFDLGKEYTYNIAVTGGILKTAGTQKADSLFTGEIEVISTSFTLTITSVVDGATNCITMSPVSSTRTANPSPIILNAQGICTNFQTGQQKVRVVLQNNLPGTIVTVNTPAGNFTATQLPSPPNTWETPSFFAPVGSTFTALATAGSCSDTFIGTFSACTQGFCPDNLVEARAISPICPGGSTDTDVYYFNSSIIPTFDNTWSYQWYQVVGGVDVAIAGQGGLIGPSGIPNLTVSAEPTPKYYKLEIANPEGCSYMSAAEEVVISSIVNPTIVGSTSVSSGVTTLYSASPSLPGTYTWQLTTPDSTTTTLPGSSSSVSITFTQIGLHTLNVTYTNGDGCTGTATLNINVTATCDQTVTLATAGITPCSTSLSATVVSGSSTLVSYEWVDRQPLPTGDIVLDSGTTTVNPLDLTTLLAGSTTNIVLIATFANGCIVESLVFPYYRCDDTFSIDLADIGAGLTFQKGGYEFGFLTDIRLMSGACGSEIVLWSGSGNLAGNGNEELMLWNDTTTPCLDQNLVDDWFGDSRTLVADATALAVSLTTEFTLRAVQFPGVTVSAVGSVLTFSGFDCNLPSGSRRNTIRFTYFRGNANEPACTVGTKNTGNIVEINYNCCS